MTMMDFISKFNIKKKLSCLTSAALLDPCALRFTLHDFVMVIIL
jgi:hypothetical protein